MRAALGHAVAEDGVINVKTISDSRIAALVNWLAVTPKILARSNMSDTEVEIVFAQFQQAYARQDRRVEAVRVEIKEICE